MSRTGGVPDCISVIHSRKSVRHFTGEAVTREELETLLRAGMAAPSAVGRAPWEFVVVTERATLDRLSAGLPYAKMLEKAGAAIVVCGVPEQAHLQKVEYAVIDGTCASENILLAAEAIGLGAVWTAAYPYEDRAAHVRTVLGIPPGVIPLNVIPVGRPTGADTPKEKYRPEKVRWERW
jgi:nitroreductase